MKRFHFLWQWPDFLFQNRCRPPSEQFYTDRWRQWAQTPRLRATRSREGSMSKADQFRKYAEEADVWGPPIQNRKRETGPDRACVHMDASCGAERAHFWRQRQSAGAKSSVRRPQLAPSSGGSMDTTTLLIIIIVLLSNATSRGRSSFTRLIVS
jgi:hypothetical protein